MIFLWKKIYGKCLPAINGIFPSNKLLERTEYHMLELRKSVPNEIESIVELESAEDVSPFIIRYTADKHNEEMHKESVIYLSVYDGDNFSSFIILSQGGGGNIEFRRIVIEKKGAGIGQVAISLMEEYCREKLNGKSIWLDVFQSNIRGQHIYKKIGFTNTGTGTYNRNLLYFEKML